MTEPISIQQLLNQYPQYSIEAYQFLRDALAFASEELGLGRRDRIDEDTPLEAEQQPENHLTGKELCDAIRQFAIIQFGLMAKPVLNSWGINKTDDFGEIVYNMIEIGLMKKSDDDEKSHFNGLYDFDEVFVQQFEIER